MKTGLFFIINHLTRNGRKDLVKTQKIVIVMWMLKKGKMNEQGWNKKVKLAKRKIILSPLPLCPNLSIEKVASFFL